MANIAIQVNPYTLEQMKHHYEGKIAARTPKNAVFLVLGDTCVITAYKTGKVTFLGNGATEEAAQWSQKDVVPTFKKEVSPAVPLTKKEVPVPSPAKNVEKEPIDIPIPKEEKVETTIEKEQIVETVIPEPKKSIAEQPTIAEEKTTLEKDVINEVPVVEEKKEVPIEKPKVVAKAATPITSPYAPPQGLVNLGLIGSYEVGSGDYFGPLSVVAVYVPKEKVPTLMKLGVMEAKGIKDKQVIEIAKKVISSVEYAAVNVSNEKYNEYLESGTSIGELKARLHNQAIRKVMEKLGDIKPEGVLIDQFVEGDTYFQYLEQEKDVIRENVYFKPKAESAHIATAAASIIARYSYLRTLEKLCEIAGFKLPRGVNLQVDKAAARLLKTYGLEALGSFVKMNFPNTQKARTMARR